MLGLQVRHFAQGTGGGIGLPDPSQFFFKRHTFFQQGVFDFVMVIAGCKAAEFEHGGLHQGLGQKGLNSGRPA
jgi:hypothetical protein